MLISPDGHIVVSNLGWVDKSALWIYDAAQDHAVSTPIGDAKYLSLFPCQDPAQFAVLHHYDGSTIRLTVHAYEEPARPLCDIVRTGAVSSFSGDLSVLKDAPRYYSAYFDPGDGHNYPDNAGNYYLLFIDPDNQEMREQSFDWFDSSYDHDYQGIVGVIELPSGNVIVSVQRDSHPVLYDPVNKKMLKKLDLAERYGNPALRLAATRGEIWADDYDALLKLDLDSLKVKQSRRLQGAAWGGASQFIGSWCFNEDESLCFVARPYSGDMLAISTENMKTEYLAKLGKQPLEAVALKDGRVIARDWKTGQFLKGMLRKA